MSTQARFTLYEYEGQTYTLDNNNNQMTVYDTDYREEFGISNNFKELVLKEGVEIQPR